MTEPSLNRCLKIRVHNTLSGSGDFVFVPSQEQKAADNRSEILQLEAELKALDAAEAQAKTAASRAERQRLQAGVELARKAAAGKLKAEQLKQQQLAEEESRRVAEAAERQRLLATKGEDEKHLAELKSAAEARRRNAAATQSVADFPTLDSALAEIRGLNQRIGQIEAGYQVGLAVIRQEIEHRHTRELAALDAEIKDEFESQSAFKRRIGQRRSEVQRQRVVELGRLDVEQLADAESAALKSRIKALAEREYILGADYLLVELGTYDAERQIFPVSLHPRPAGKDASPPLKLAFNGTLPLPPDEARRFKQQWKAGLVRVEVTATPEDGVKTVQLVNEADGSRRLQYGDQFITEAEKRVIREKFEKLDRPYRPIMLTIPAGSFSMGSTRGGSDERPVHHVSVPTFEMAQTEVTQGQWRAVMGENPSYFNGCGDDCPVEMVSWDDVQAYLKKLSGKTGHTYRLPSEAEWEYACRAGGQHAYCGNDDIDAVAWYDSKTVARTTHAVAGKQANGFGLYDMSGNVWEWVDDCYHDSYTGAPTDGGAWTGWLVCDARVVRGGSWNSDMANARPAHRIRFGTASRFINSGFRPARGVAP